MGLRQAHKRTVFCTRRSGRYLPHISAAASQRLLILLAKRVFLVCFFVTHQERAAQFCIKLFDVSDNGRINLKAAVRYSTFAPPSPTTLRALTCSRVSGGPPPRATQGHRPPKFCGGHSGLKRSGSYPRTWSPRMQTPSRSGRQLYRPLKIQIRALAFFLIL